jgi:serine protease AprX
MANPGALSCVVAVGAVNYNDAAADFTSRGPVTWQDTEFGDYVYNPGIGLIRPDVCAPGVSIKSLDYNNISGYTNMDGTSQATPCVAGIVALMLQKNPELTPAEICRILEETSVKLTPTKSNITGVGRVDALAAVNAVEAYDGINEQSIEAEIFPNPSIGSFTIICEGLKQVSVYSVDGRLVKTFEVNETECRIDDLERGVYLVRMETSNETIVQKIVKM